MDVVEVPVELKEKRYAVRVGSGFIDRLDEFLPSLDWKMAAILTDSTVGPLYEDRVKAALERMDVSPTAYEIEPGEQSKTLECASLFIQRLVDERFSRADLVVALGGGVVGDLAGFAASVYKRGVAILQVPTTLIGQVDSAIGGKTGVDLPAAKNLVGSFHQPVAVIADVDLLKTLPERQFLSGLAEVAKYSFLRPLAFEESLERVVVRPLGSDTDLLTSLVSACVREKVRVVEADEYDTGVRAVLNYGHTLGHALEASSGYEGTYTHGEGVSVGMVYAAIVAEESGQCDPGLAERHRRTLEALGLPVRPFDPAPEFEVLLGSMVHDKKNQDGLTMVLLKEEGRPGLYRDLSRENLRMAYETLIGG